MTQTFDFWQQQLGIISHIPFRLIIQRTRTADKTKLFSYINLVPDFSLEQAMSYVKNRNVSQAFDQPVFDTASRIDASEPLMLAIGDKEE